MYNILIVDDSALVRKFICDIIESVQGFSVKEACSDGETALKLLSKERYDAVVLSLSMSKSSGLDVMEQMKKQGIYTPVLATSINDDSLAPKAFECGAKDFVVRPFRLSPMEKPLFSRKFTLALHYVVGDGQVHGRTYRDPLAKPAPAVVRPTFRTGTKTGETVEQSGARDVSGYRSFAHKSALTRTSTLSSHSDNGSSQPLMRAPASSYRGKYSLIAIASSTGGPQALHTLIPMLPKNIGVPVVIVQHMPKGFTASLAERIDAKANLKVKEAENGEVLKNNCAYIAPGGRHLQIVNNPSGQLACKVYDDPPVNNLRPCADVMYESLKKVNCDHIICTVLTGMGADGSQGIKSLREVKDLYVITQSEDTCVVYGMPKATDQAGLSNESQPIDQISQAITKKLGV